MAGRASIVGAAVTHVGKVRDHNEDAHFLDADAGLFLVCDGMGGHAAGEVASALAVDTIRGRWLDEQITKLTGAWLAKGTADTKKQLLGALRAGVLAAHDRILAEGARDDAKSGMGTTVVAAIAIGNELMFAHAGDSRAYLVRDGISMQLTEDHTLLARLLAAGIDVDVSGEGARFRSMLTNALGIGQECKVATFVVPLADGDRFLLCSDGISEYVPEAEVGTVLTKHANPTRAAERLVELALERGGGDNATAVVISVVEAGKTPQPAEHRRLDDEAIGRCPLWAPKVTPQQRLRALRIAIPRDHSAGERLPAHTLGDRVTWIILEGALSYEGREVGPGALVYPESLVSEAPGPERDALAVARSDVRALALRADDFRELCEDDAELGEVLLETVGTLVAPGHRRRGRTTRSGDRADTERAQSNSDVIDPPPPVMAPLPISVRPSPNPQQSAQDQAQLRTPRTSPPHPPPGAPSRPSSPPAAAMRASSPPLAATAPAPSRGSDPKLARPAAAGAAAAAPAVQARPSSPARPRSTPPEMPAVTDTVRDDDDGYEGYDASITFDNDTEFDADDIDLATSPRIRRAPSEPEIETLYEMDAEPPPLPEPDDEIEMIVSVDDGEGRVTEKVTETNDATVILTMTESSEEDEEPTKIQPMEAEALAISRTVADRDPEPPVAAAPRRGRRASESRDK